MDDSNITITLVLSTAEAIDFAVLLPRVIADRNRFAWRSVGDTPDTVARWAVVLTRLGEELGKAGYPAVRRGGAPQ
jgi:hypothetical protein